MPLTPAEKMKRYREKLKKDPQKYEDYKKKDLQRIKIKSKKIAEMTEQEIKQKRKSWRDQKRKQKSKKNQNPTIEPQATSSNCKMNVKKYHPLKYN
jgi:flagellar biosynthesis GTPase FlhF